MPRSEIRGMSVAIIIFFILFFQIYFSLIFYCAIFAAVLTLNLLFTRRYYLAFRWKGPFK